MLMEAKGLEQEGRYSHAQLVQLKASLQTHLAAADAQPLASLEAESPHLVYNPRDHEFPEAMSEIANNVAFYSYENEEDFLKHLDNKLGEPLPLATNDKDQTGPNYFSNLSAREMDREVELRNPQSVHNWLKKHNISIDGTEEKPDTDTPAASGKKGSRKLAQKIGDRALERARERDDGSPIGSVAGNKPDMDLAEEDTGLDDVPSKRRKSRGDNDDTYRPKGGRSGKVKRKREDGESRGSSKKPKTSMGGMSDA
ncbi:hypothetical protein K461DRAFT_158170 [Myriangium duriaei CBS 260.36]|uniref:INO80 complex subunit 3-like middle region domain-containing protein n=1 Tax=Myriangium duriaei CBS 260.36 TaxID=1168546 RepID=A0A9P4MG76_9PEZI|nr:hypothetical protein K461DRAFT_158170 [Myriangium duriaei CBS 260.36]